MPAAAAGQGARGGGGRATRAQRRGWGLRPQPLRCSLSKNPGGFGGRSPQRL